MSSEGFIMRPSPILLALTLFIAPTGASSQQPMAPVSLDDPCSVSSDSRWTPQEKFVWERVCVGDVANFNAAPEYGGDLDPTKAAGWPQSRILRPAFLQMILFKDPYRRVLTRRGVLIRGARFTEAVDLENAELEHPLELRDSLLEKGVNLRRVRSKFPIGFSRSNVGNAVDMYELQLDADLVMGNGEFTDVSLKRAHVSLLDMRGSKVTGKLDMSEFRVDRSLDMSDQAEFAEVVLTDARVGSLDLGGSKVTGKLEMIELRVDRSLDMSDQAEFAGVELGGAHVNGHLDLSGSKVSGKLDMRAFQVDQFLAMTDKAEFADVVLTAAHVGSHLDLSGSKVTGKLDMDRLQIGAELVMNDSEFSDVEFVGAHVGRYLRLNGSKVTGKLNMNGLQVSDSLFMSHKAQFMDVMLVGTHVGGDLDLRGSKVNGKLDMYGLQVRKSLGMSHAAEFTEVELVAAHVGGDPLPGWRESDGQARHEQTSRRSISIRARRGRVLGR
jgi:hypothetical protein